MLAIAIDYPKPLRHNIDGYIFHSTSIGYFEDFHRLPSLSSSPPPIRHYTHASPEAVTLSILISKCQGQIPRKHGGGYSRHCRMRSSKEGDSELAEVLLRILEQVF